MNNAVIFDVDGTLWNTSEIVARAWNLAIKENSDLGYAYTAEYLRKTAFGKPMSEIGHILLPGCSEEEVARLSKICFEYEDRAVVEEKAEIYDGVAEVMDELKKKGWKLYIVSNCQLGYVEACMAQCGIEDYILDHLCFGETGKRKGETIRMLMERNGLSEAVYVGDTEGDMEASREAGIPFIYAAYGFGDVKDPDYSIDSFRSLPELLESRG